MLRAHKNCWSQRAFAIVTVALNLVLACCVASQPATAQSLSLDRAARVPLDVVEVVSGGNWEQGSARGFWRVVTIMVPNVTPGASACSAVFVQWIGSRTHGAPFEILAASPLLQFNALEFPSASVAMENESEQGGRIVVTGEGPDRVLTLLTFQINLPGDVVFLPAEDGGAAVNGRAATATKIP